LLSPRLLPYFPLLFCRSEFRQEYQAENPGNKSVANVSHLLLFFFLFFFRLYIYIIIHLSFFFLHAELLGEQGGRGEVARYVR
jgi:hypothetical protein